MNKHAHTEVRVFTDGGARGNPGPAAVGVVILDEKDNMISKSGKFIGVTTNNVAEYSALIEALELLKEIDAYRIVFYTDSNLVYSQIKGLWKIKSPDLKVLNEQAKKMLYSLPNYDFVHIPREKNKDADRLVNKALDERMKSSSQ